MPSVIFIYYESLTFIFLSVYGYRIYYSSGKKSPLFLNYSSVNDHKKDTVPTQS